LAMLDSATGGVVKATLKHEGNLVREFYDHLPRPVRVGIEATGSMQWFVNLMEELGIECLVDHPAEIRAADLFRLNSQNWKTERMIWRRPIPG
jgi:transposase